MADGNRNRTIDVLNTSVSELMLLTVFFVLLALAIARADLLGAESDRDGLVQRIVSLEHENAQLNTRLAELQKNMSMSERELDETLIGRKAMIDSLEKQVEDLNKSLARTNLKRQSLEAELKKATSERDELRSKLAGITGTHDNAAALSDAISQLKRIAAANNIDPDAPLSALVRDLERELGALRTTTANLRNRLKSAGISEKDKPDSQGEVITARCWWNQNRGVPDSVFRIEVQDDGFIAVPTWPKIRDRDARAARSVVAMANAGKVSVKEFRKLGATLRNESERRSPPCIFVVDVQISDQTASKTPSAKRFQELRRVVGRYFYIK